MQPNDFTYRNETASESRYSSIGILSIVFCILSFLPTFINIFTGGLISRILESLKIDLLNYVIFGWFAVFLLAAFILSIIDLVKPNRKKSLSKASLIICSIFIIIVLLFLLTLYTSSPNAYTAFD